jgi:molybdopterin-guanine dinucleotide biosynthesis protein A
MEGREKAFVRLAEVPLIERVISRIAPQVEGIVINANGDAARFRALGREVLADVLDLRTPLAGLHAVLHHGQAAGFDAVLTVPSDSPLLPLNLVPRLAEAGAATGAAIASSGGQRHHLTGLWSTAMAAKLEEMIDRKHLRRMMDLAMVFEIAEAEWVVTPHDPFLNINTPEDLAEAERLLA